MLIVNSKELRKALAARRLTQGNAARIAGLSDSTLSRATNEDYPVNLVTAQKLREAFGDDVVYEKAEPMTQDLTMSPERKYIRIDACDDNKVFNEIVNAEIKQAEAEGYTLTGVFVFGEPTKERYILRFERKE